MGEMLALLREIRDALTAPREGRTPLGPDSLVTRDECRAELRCGKDKMTPLLHGLPTYRVTGCAWTLYRWGDVLGAVRRQANVPDRGESAVVNLGRRSGKLAG